MPAELVVEAHQVLAVLAVAVQVLEPVRQARQTQAAVVVAAQGAALRLARLAVRAS